MTYEFELERERTYLVRLYDEIDQQRREAADLLAMVLADRQSHLQGIVDRDALSAIAERRLHRFGSRTDGLCFGKVVEGGTSHERYIGRIGITDGEQEPLLVDWRAPAAEPFYRATLSSPMGMALRRHLIMAGRDLVGIEDDILEADALDETTRTNLVGEAALLAALSRERTGYMGDIVATIQRDQDEIIRAPLRGTVVVSGGPGTGKTVVALHRAAYLLYSHAAQIGTNGVLVVGPSSLFLRYIERVLPSLGEASVAMMQWTDLYPEVAPVPDTNLELADLKGSLAMAELLRKAVRTFQRAPEKGVLALNPYGRRVRIDRDALVAIRRTTRATNLPHNQAQATYKKLLARELGIGRENDQPAVNACRHSINGIADQLWPMLTPQELLRLLFSHESLLSHAARDVLAPEAYRSLLRDTEAPFTASDLPLLDELRVLLGVSEQTASAPQRDEHTKHLADMAAEAYRLYADEEPETFLQVPINAGQMQQRFAAPQVEEEFVHRALRNPDWHYAHIVVDEAQDVSAMQWRALARRCLSRSMTIVGDPDQRTRPSDIWWVDRIKQGLGTDAVDEHTLHVNYRTPAVLMGPANEVRAENSSNAQPHHTTYVREGAAPWSLRCTTINAASLTQAITSAQELLGRRGRIAVISASGIRATVDSVISAVTGIPAVTGAARLGQPIAGFSASEVKGLEFDAVVVVDPQAIESEFGWRQLYVALTRATSHLGVLEVDGTHT